MAASSSINLSSSNDDVTEAGWMAVPRNCFKTVTSGGGTYLSPKYFAAHFERVFGSVTAYLWGRERGDTLSRYEGGNNISKFSLGLDTCLRESFLYSQF